MFPTHSFRRQLSSPSFRRLICDSNPRPLPLRQLHASAAIQAPRKRNFFSSNANLQQEATSEGLKDLIPPQARKAIRSPPGKASLRRVAVEAQRSRANTQRVRDGRTKVQGNNRVTAISVADQFDMNGVTTILQSHGFSIDPDRTGFEPDEVIHARNLNNGDIFVFPSGSLVSWDLPEDVASNLASKILLPAAIDPHMEQMEMEDLEYEEDPKRDNSTMKGDVILLGTKTESQTEELPK
jgi:uncharacterized Rmd1/YagE family protein